MPWLVFLLSPITSRSQRITGLSSRLGDGKRLFKQEATFYAKVLLCSKTGTFRALCSIGCTLWSPGHLASSCMIFNFDYMEAKGNHSFTCFWRVPLEHMKNQMSALTSLMPSSLWDRSNRPCLFSLQSSASCFTLPIFFYWLSSLF